MTRLAALFVLALGACAATVDVDRGETKQFAVPVTAAETPPYRIAPGDGLAIRFPFDVAYNTELIVRPDGKFSMPFAEEVHAAGKTVAELDVELTTKLSRHLRFPELAISVTSFAQQKVYVGGEVRTPSMINLVPGMTLWQAITQSGGIPATGAADSVVLIRAAGPGKREVRKVDLSGQGLVVHDIELAGFDIVHVPRTKIADVGTWVEQYINALVPRGATFGAFYNLKPNQ